MGRFTKGDQKWHIGIHKSRKKWTMEMLDGQKQLQPEESGLKIHVFKNYFGYLTLLQMSRIKSQLGKITDTKVRKKLSTES